MIFVYLSFPPFDSSSYFCSFLFNLSRHTLLSVKSAIHAETAAVSFHANICYGNHGKAVTYERSTPAFHANGHFSR